MLDRRVAWSLVLVAIIARGAAVWVLQSHRIPRSTYEHGEIASNLLAGRGFSVRFLGADGPTSQQAPVYPVLVAAAYAVGGPGTPEALSILELGQALLGGLMVAGILALAREVAPDRPRIAACAGLIAAVHPTLVYSATHVQVASLATALLVWTFALAYRTGRTRRARLACGTGSVAALLALTDPILVLSAPGIVWAVARGQGSITRARQSLALILLTASVGVAPWIIRNALVHGELVWIKSTFGYAFWQGNCALSEGTDKVVRASVDRALEQGSDGVRAINAALWNARHEAGYLDDIALTRADYRELGSLSEPERSRRLFHRALADLRRDPMRYPKLCLRRLRYFVLFDTTNPKTRNIVYRASHLTLTIFSVCGLALMGPTLRRRIGPTLLTAGLITLFHTLTIVSARFHLPLEPLMGLWAACGMDRCASWIRTDATHGASVSSLSCAVPPLGASRHVERTRPSRALS
jgi:4-amino-4-deoxy-L-arabinose transferase-like glycosyltransferase